MTHWVGLYARRRALPFKLTFGLMGSFPATAYFPLRFPAPALGPAARGPQVKGFAITCVAPGYLAIWRYSAARPAPPPDMATMRTADC
jgi:hypothetical protein